MTPRTIGEPARTTERQGAPSTDRGEQTRRHILETAAGAFAERGYAGASLNDVIRMSGVTKGGFYFHFPSKEALALAVLQDKQEQWAGRVLAATMRYESAFEQLAAIPGALCDLHEQDPSARAIGRLCMELSEDPDLAPATRRQFGAWVELTASIVRRAQAEGSLRPDVTPEAAAETLVAAFVGLEMMSDVQSHRSDLRGRVERYVELFRILFRPPSSPAS
jgi:AcrR family transcriptional regulator